METADRFPEERVKNWAALDTGTAEREIMTISGSLGNILFAIKDLKVGDQVIIHAEKQGEKLTATSIRFRHCT